MKKNFKFKSGDTSFILDNLNTAVFRTTVDDPGTFIDVNAAFLKTFGYSNQTEIDSMTVIDLYKNNEDRDQIRKELNREGFLRNREISFNRKDGTAFLGRVSSVLVRDEAGNTLYIDGVVDDMTEHKLQVSALHEVEKRLKERQAELLEERKVFFKGPVIQIHWPMGEQEPLHYISDNVLDILGYPPEDFISGKILYPDLVHKEDRAELQEHIHSIIKAGSDVVSVQPYRLKCKNGQYLWVQDYGYVKKNGGGNPVGIAGYIYDITKQYLATSAKREIEQTQIEERNMFMAGPIIVLKWNLFADQPLIRVSENVQDILGYTVEQMVGGDVLFEDLIHPEDIKRVRETAKVAIDAGLDAFDTTAYRIRKSDDSYLWMNDHSTIIRDANGQVKNISGILYDISSNLEAEEELKVKEQTYRSLFNSITEAIFVQDPDTYEIKDVNETMLEMYGYDRKDVLGTSVQKYSSEENIESQLGDVLSRVKDEGQQTYEWHAKHKSGESFWVEVKARLATIDGKDQILANVRDLSARKNILVKLKQSLKEQELLLREVHHRVKNNMQVIVSLLNLQAEHTQNDELFEIFRETQNRIRTMALIHEKLFRSDSMASVDFGDYINTLVIDLNSFYTIDSRKIQTHLDLEQMDLDITKAIPCGLIINELITNALKYAFPDKRDGDIWLSVKLVGDGRALVRVRDNGVGIDPNIDFETTPTMGLRIVRILTEQLNGKMIISREGGSQFSLEFALIDED